MCTSNFKQADASSSFGNFKDYANSADGKAEIAVGSIGLSEAVSSYFKTKSENSYIDYQRSILLSNAQSLDRSSLDVVEAGRDSIAWQGYQGRMEQSAQINEQSNRGIDVNVGSALSHRQGLKNINKINIDNTRYNAMISSFGMQTKALEARQKAEAVKLNKGNSWANALISLGKTALNLYAVSGMGETNTKTGDK